MYGWYFDIPSFVVVDVQLILWVTQYFDGRRTVDTLRYSVFFWLTYCWYFAILSISALFILLILSILDIRACRYSIPSISRFDNVAILHAERKRTKPTTKISTHWCPRIDLPFPPLLLLLFFLSRPFFLVFFPFLNRILFFRFLSSGTLMRFARRMASRYWCHFLPFARGRTLKHQTITSIHGDPCLLKYMVAHPREAVSLDC